jgi:hypothetical protein
MFVQIVNFVEKLYTCVLSRKLMEMYSFHVCIRCGGIENQQKAHSQMFHSKIKVIRQTHEDFDKSTSKQFSKTTDDFHRLESAVIDLSIKVDDQTSRLERLFSLHQKMLNRMDLIENTQKSHNTQIDKIHSLMKGVTENNARNDAEIMLHKHITEASIANLKDDITDVQNVSKDCSKKLQAVLSNQTQGQTAVSNLTKDFKNKISHIESWLNTTAPKPPSPKLLVVLALKFEDRAVEKHCEDPAHMFSVSMSTELAKDIATCAHWLVYHIVEATDVDVLTRIMKGPQDVSTVYDASDPSNSLDPITPHEPTGGNKYTKSSKLTHEEFCSTTRESMLLRYLEKFQKQLSQSRDEVGAIRKEARAMFTKRFIDSLDLSLQKHDVIVLNTSSAMGRNPGHVTGRPHDSSSGPPACMACDRPLRMRTTSRSIGELYDKLLLSGKKSSEVKREVLRNQIISPQNRPTSPLHSYRCESDHNNGAVKSKPTFSDSNFESSQPRFMTGGSNNHHFNGDANHDYQYTNTPPDDEGTGRKGKNSFLFLFLLSVFIFFLDCC